ncbi:hypothetical protein [Halalkalibacter akibai]|uniref:Uncharacterized protein n=1 Tax=Halalkalibacter akibai (strain ATCC 43226 / DSM 21942 / CIP 109018 / JCM 9157 / 1139) TaxID=1236973 RepID=W4QS23_HALA3|nr:hypothetical protein [Halalkalibacter akibai]GAE34737.1 hypothetical protein JCM9157_1814 [Halalkalibacter akibai JCM 9157]
MKQTRNLVKKYHNILINRSGIFNKENQMLVEQLISFYHDFIVTYEEHKAYSSNILILSDYVITSVEQLTLKRG